MAVLAFHRDLFTYLAQQRRATWRQGPILPTSDRRVGLLGLGTLGTAVARQLSGFGFKGSGWSRSRRMIADVACFSGEPELSSCVATAEILVCLLPPTSETQGILNASLFSKLPHGANLINVGRGKHLCSGGPA
jgi:glyoxylate/hydroxypyruvate reductase